MHMHANFSGAIFPMILWCNPLQDQCLRLLIPSWTGMQFMQIMQEVSRER